MNKLEEIGKRYSEYLLHDSDTQLAKDLLWLIEEVTTKQNQVTSLLAKVDKLEKTVYAQELKLEIWSATMMDVFF